MCFWYSFRVVAPTQRSSPRARAGFSMLEASIAPSADPAPTTVCSSSMKRMTSPSRLLDLLEHGLQAVLELAAVLGPRDEGAQVERDHALVLQRLRDVALHDALGQALHDRGLAHAGLADEDGVVLGAAGEHLDHAAHLVVAADHGVELAPAGERGEVAAVALEGLVAVLRVGVVHALVAADLAQHLEEGVAGHAVALQGVGGGGLRVEEGEQQVLGGDVLVLQGLRLAQGRLEDGVELGRDVGRSALGAREGGEGPVQVGAEAADVRSHLAEGGRNDASLLLEQGLQQVLGRHLGWSLFSAAVCAAVRASWALTVN